MYVYFDAVLTLVVVRVFCLDLYVIGGIMEAYIRIESALSGSPYKRALSKVSLLSLPAISVNACS